MMSLIYTYGASIYIYPYQLSNVSHVLSCSATNQFAYSLSFFKY